MTRLSPRNSGDARDLTQPRPAESPLTGGGVRGKGSLGQTARALPGSGPANHTAFLGLTASWVKTTLIPQVLEERLKC